MVYVKALVTFIDVLGFSDLVKADKIGDKVLELFRMLRMFGTSDSFGYRASVGGVAIHFSDSIVRCIPLANSIERNVARNLILHELEDLIHIQGMLACQSVLIRGGISVGLANLNEGGVFGPAFIDAYTLESKHALYPRIILHPDIAKDFSTNGERGLGIYADDGLRLTRNSDDGFQFIDYLRNFPREVHNYSSEIIRGIEHSYMLPRKEFIQKEIEKAPVLSTVSTKYVWLAGYHNEVAKELIGEDLSNFLIDLH